MKELTRKTEHATSETRMVYKDGQGNRVFSAEIGVDGLLICKWQTPARPNAFREVVDLADNVEWSEREGILKGTYENRWYTFTEFTKGFSSIAVFIEDAPRDINIDVALRKIEGVALQTMDPDIELPLDLHLQLKSLAMC